MLIGDSAYPLALYPTEWNGEPIVGWGFYIGGNTPHVWTVDEVAVLKKTYQYLLPIFTKSDPQSANSITDTSAAIKQLLLLDAPEEILVQWDLESAVDSVYTGVVNTVMHAAGYEVELYGSSSTVMQNAIPYGGYDTADWTSKDYAPTSTGDQFIDVGTYDLNDFKSSAPLWNMKPVLVSTPTVSVPATDEDENMSVTSTGGRAGLSFASGSRHALQISGDPGVIRDATFKVVINVKQPEGNGPYVLTTAAVLPSCGALTVELPKQYVQDAAAAYVYCSDATVPYELLAV
jgi:hypothetical protein